MSLNLVHRAPWGKRLLLLVAIVNDEEGMHWRYIKVLSFPNLFILIED